MKGLVTSVVFCAVMVAMRPASSARDGGGEDDQLLFRPQAVKVPTETIERWKRECATKGTPTTCYDVAVDYAQIQGDEPKAVEYLRPLCKKDYVLGCFNLGGILVKEIATRKEGLAAFRKACTLSKAKAGTPTENDATESACQIAEVVAKNLGGDYMDIAGKLGLAATHDRSTAPAIEVGSKPPEPSSNARELVDRDVTGRYKTEGGSVCLVEGADELWLVYESRWGADHSCSCISQAKRQEDGRWTMRGDLNGEIAVTSSEVSISNREVQPECCGAYWPGVGPVRNHPAPLERCVVTAPKLSFHAADQSLTKAYLVAGDRVEAIEQELADSDFVIARFVGKKRTTVGLLEMSGLRCARK
ncbi:MAG TPA: hypothetical protein VHJ20_18035 [Polyangia bacterium]|nr:hypothetical protein [Polyangia bacterium]